MHAFEDMDHTVIQTFALCVRCAMMTKQPESILFLPDQFYRGASQEMRMFGAN